MKINRREALKAVGTAAVATFVGQNLPAAVEEEFTPSLIFLPFSGSRCSCECGRELDAGWDLLLRNDLFSSYKGTYIRWCDNLACRQRYIAYRMDWNADARTFGTLKEVTLEDYIESYEKGVSGFPPYRWLFATSEAPPVFVAGKRGPFHYSNVTASDR